MTAMKVERKGNEVTSWRRRREIVFHGGPMRGRRSRGRKRRRRRRQTLRFVGQRSPVLFSQRINRPDDFTQ